MQCLTASSSVATPSSLRGSCCSSHYRLAVAVPSTSSSSHHGSSSRSSSRRPQAAPQNSSPSQTTQQQQQKTYADMTIDDLDTSYCDDFVCTSSPAVEQTVRSLARDIGRLSYNTNFFQPDASFSDGVRSFKGSDKYRKHMWPRAVLKGPKAVVTKMAMLDNGRAKIDWLLSGQLSAFPLNNLPVSSVFELNLLTGRVINHTESWDLSKLSPPVAAAVTASRVLWSASSGGRDAADAVSKAAAESLQSLSSDEEDEYMMNPNDPTRFFQKNDNTMNDAFMIATGVAALYLVYKVFEQIETL